MRRRKLVTLGVVLAAIAVTTAAAFVAITTTTTLTVKEPLRLDSARFTSNMGTVTNCTITSNTASCTLSLFAGEFGTFSFQVTDLASVPIIVKATPTVTGGGGFVNVTPATPGRFVLQGVARLASDPTDATNEVISMDTNGGSGVAFRTLGVKVGDLDGKLTLKYYLKDRDCGGGSPRIQLAVDLDGDGRSDGNAFGYVGPAPSFVGCTQNSWQTQDLQDGVARWDLTQLPGWSGPYVVPWAQAKAFIANKTNHKILSGALVDDSWWLPSATGQAYYDEITIGNAIFHSAADLAVPGDPLILSVKPTALGGPGTFVFGLQVSPSMPPGDVTITFEFSR